MSSLALPVCNLLQSKVYKYLFSVLGCVCFSRSCRGAHEVNQFHCSKVSEYSCGRQCGRLLPCGNHSCERGCHLVIRPPSPGHVSSSLYYPANCMSVCMCCRLVRIVFHVRGIVRNLVGKVAFTRVLYHATQVSFPLWVYLCVIRRQRNLPCRYLP